VAEYFGVHKVQIPAPRGSTAKRRSSRRKLDAGAATERHCKCRVDVPFSGNDHSEDYLRGVPFRTPVSSGTPRFDYHVQS
jgi:hypothetical protein